jgi:hypothetical protein
MAEYAPELKMQSDTAAALKAAERAKAPTETVAHLQARLDALPKEAAARAAFAEAEKRVAGGKPAEARGLLTAFMVQHGDTAEFVRQQEKLKTLTAALAEKLKQASEAPGLWASYWSGDQNDIFAKFHEAAVWNQKLAQSFGGGAPRPGMPSNSFGIRFGGWLRVPEEGAYAIEFRADDKLSVWIGGKLLGRENLSGVNGNIRFAKGDHPIFIEYAEHVKNAAFSLRWKPPSAADLVEIPPEVLFHNPEEKEKYQKRP